MAVDPDDAEGPVAKVDVRFASLGKVVVGADGVAPVAAATGAFFGGSPGAIWLAVNMRTSSRDPVTLQFKSNSGALPFRVICCRSSLVVPVTGNPRALHVR